VATGEDAGQVVVAVGDGGVGGTGWLCPTREEGEEVADEGQGQGRHTNAAVDNLHG
jgi:hypothetical protein